MVSTNGVCCMVMLNKMILPSVKNKKCRIILLLVLEDQKKTQFEVLKNSDPMTRVFTKILQFFFCPKQQSQHFSVQYQDIINNVVSRLSKRNIQRPKNDQREISRE